MREALQAIIIDDEQASRSMLVRKISETGCRVRVLAEAATPEEGIKLIEDLHPDLIFLDIEMPRMNGFSMLEQCRYRNFEVIFTTAFDHYAIQAIRISALDYLVKPVSAEELSRAIRNAEEKREKPSAAGRIENLLQNMLQEKSGLKKLAVSSLDGIRFIDLHEIISLEAEGNYTILHLKGNVKITASKTLKEFEDMLPTSSFFRIHHHAVIHLEAVTRYVRGDGGQVHMSDGRVLDVSRRRKDDFLKMIR